MNPENIKARISLGKSEQGDIAFIYDFNLLKVLNINRDSMFGDYNLDVGTVIEFQERKYKINNINTSFIDKTRDMSNPPGINVYGYGELLDYNFEITYGVEPL